MERNSPLCVRSFPQRKILFFAANYSAGWIASVGHASAQVPQSVHVSLRTPCCCKASRTARWYARRKSCPISSAAWYCKSSGLLAILPPPFLGDYAERLQNLLPFSRKRFPAWRKLNFCSLARSRHWRSWPASPKEKRSGGHSFLWKIVCAEFQLPQKW